MKLTFRIPWEAMCSDNRKFVKGYVLSSQYRNSKNLIGLHATRAASKAKWVRQTGPLSLTVTVVEPDHRRRDLNWSKNLKDGITESGAVWWDDSQVRVEHWESLATDKANAGAHVTIGVRDASQTKTPETPAPGLLDVQAPQRRPRQKRPRTPNPSGS